MELKEYFEKTEGTGVLSTADSDGNVDSAVYGRPTIMDDGKVAFIMQDRLTHKNIQSNPKASYLFIEKGEVPRGKRLVLTKLREETDTRLIQELLDKRRCPEEEGARSPKFLVFFRLDCERPLASDRKQEKSAKACCPHCK